MEEGHGSRVDAREQGACVALLLLTYDGILWEWDAGPNENLLQVADKAGRWAVPDWDARANRAAFSDGFILSVMATGGWPRNDHAPLVAD